MDFQQQIKHPKWQKKRLEIMNRDNFKCQSCSQISDKEHEEASENNQLHVHHFLYKKNKKYWEYENKYLITLCETCHKRWHLNNDALKEFLMVLPERQIELFLLLEKVSLMNDKQINKICEISQKILEK